jgi:hypothetical protein
MPRRIYRVQDTLAKQPFNILFEDLGFDAGVGAHVWALATQSAGASAGVALGVYESGSAIIGAVGSSPISGPGVGINIRKVYLQASLNNNDNILFGDGFSQSIELAPGMTWTLDDSRPDGLVFVAPAGAPVLSWLTYCVLP